MNGEVKFFCENSKRKLFRAGGSGQGGGGVGFGGGGQGRCERFL